MADRILGTRVPDTAIHRASMWLEKLAFGGDPEAVPGPLTEEDVERFIAECDLPFTPEELHEAIGYYAANWRATLLGGSGVDMAVVTPHAVLSMEGILRSVWLDGFRHGAATATGKRGLSHREQDLGREV